MNRLLYFLVVVVTTLISCRKFPSDLPDMRIPPAVPPLKFDTIPDRAEFKIKLAKDSVHCDETLVFFNHKAVRTFSPDEDAQYLMGFGQVSLSTISDDGRDLAINAVPYSEGMSIGLDVRTKADGSYFLTMSYQNRIPAGIQIFLKDAYIKDSIDVRNANYHFSIRKIDTNTFGRSRFSLILKPRQ